MTAFLLRTPRKGRAIAIRRGALVVLGFLAGCSTDQAGLATYGGGFAPNAGPNSGAGGGAGSPDAVASGVCIPGATVACQCGGQLAGASTCLPDGSGYSDCVCQPGADQSAGYGGSGGQEVAGYGGSGGQEVAGYGGSGGQQAGTGGQTSSAGSPDGGAVAGSGPPPPDAGATKDSAAAGDTGQSNPSDPFDAARQACVDHINELRATQGLPPYNRATPATEACSDQGAQKDGSTNSAHSSAGDCPGMGGQNTCPNWPMGFYGSTLEELVIKCLDQMWAEGEPPVPRDQCIADYQGCFMKYGHYINMTSTTSSVVSCGFYEVSSGVWWMNQDYGR